MRDQAVPAPVNLFSAANSWQRWIDRLKKKGTSSCHLLIPVASSLFWRKTPLGNVEFTVYDADCN